MSRAVFGIDVNEAPEPLKVVAVKVPLEELKVKLDPLLGAKFPVAAVVNSGKQVVSVDSSATVTLVATWASVAVVCNTLSRGLYLRPESI